MTDLIERRRLREEPHLRSIQEQTLDTLLRIEELLSKPIYVINTLDTPAEDTKATQAKPKGRR